MELYDLIDFTGSSGLSPLALRVFLLLTVLSVSWLVYKRMECWVRKLPPGPSGFPILGYAPFLCTDLHKSFAELNKRYGKICSMVAVFRRFIIVGDYDTAKELLSRREVLDRIPNFFNIVPGEGGFAGMNGQPWERGRKFMMQAMRNMGLGRNPWNERIQETVADLVLDVATQNGKPFNVSVMLAEYSVRNITALLFEPNFANTSTNADINILETGNKTFRQHFRFTSPFVVHPTLLKYFIKFNIDGYAKKGKDMESFGQVLRREVIKRLNSEEYDPSTDLIKNYLRCSLKENSSPEAISRSVDNLVGDISVFVSSTDTATAPTQWLLLLMAAYPKVQAKVHKELDDVVGINGLISWNDWTKFPYSMACIKEMLRWVPTLPVYIPRRASETFEFRGYTIPKDSAIIVNCWTMHRDPKYWHNPAEYIPERFLCREENELAKVQGYAPFSFGKRACPGENISLMTLFLYFTGIMQKFTVGTPAGAQPDLTQHFEGTMQPTSQDLCFWKR